MGAMRNHCPRFHMVPILSQSLDNVPIFFRGYSGDERSKAYCAMARGRDGERLAMGCLQENRCSRYSALLALAVGLSAEAPGGVHLGKIGCDSPHTPICAGEPVSLGEGQPARSLPRPRRARASEVPPRPPSAAPPAARLGPGVGALSFRGH